MTMTLGHDDNYGAETLAAVRPDDALAYLASRGWRRVREVRRMDRWVWPENEDREVLVPLEPDYDDFAERVYDLIRGLSLAEERSPESVLRDLLTVRADTVRVEVRPRGGRADATIPLDDGVTVVAEARNLLVAAARSTVQRRAQHPSGAHPRQVQEYLRGVRLGQTEQGSFVVALLSPVEPPAAREGRQLRLPQTDPFPGRVVEMLAVATDAAASTADRVARGDGPLDEFHQAIERGVSANLCEALARIGGAQRGGFTVRFGWAPARREPGSVVAVGFSDRTIPVLRAAAELLRSGDGRWMVIEGRIQDLGQEVEGGPGWIRIERPHGEGEPRRVVVRLSPRRYDQAAHANAEHRHVRIEGLVRRDGRSWVLADPRNFTVLDQ